MKKLTKLNKLIVFVMIIGFSFAVLSLAACGGSGGGGGSRSGPTILGDDGASGYQPSSDRPPSKPASNPPGNPPSNPINYGISLSAPSTHTFPSAVLGYGSQTPLTVTVKNTGIQETDTLNVTLSGTNSGSFILSHTTLPSIDSGNNTSFDVEPETGLAVGIYTATVTVSGGNGITAGFNITFNVTNPVGQGSFSITFDQITDAAPTITGVTIYRSSTNGPTTATISVDNPGQYSSISWYINGVTGTGASFILNSQNYNYSSVGVHFLTVEVVKGGIPYNKTITITVAN